LVNIKREKQKFLFGKKIFFFVKKNSIFFFFSAPEVVFNLEELRERKVYSYANMIQVEIFFFFFRNFFFFNQKIFQRFFLRFSMNNYYYSIQSAGNQKLAGRKERRRISLER
jgi:hypothetical protein